MRSGLPFTPISSTKQSRRVLYVLVFTLVFEGIVRKLTPAVVGIAVFFLKDLLCLFGFTILLKVQLKGTLAWLYKSWRYLSLMLIPLLFYTSFFDWQLGLFAAKQYLLYVIVGLLIPIAFPPHFENSFKQFYTRFTWLILPTSLIALLQNSLPPTHWLNLSTSNESLEAFSAAGYLRVSSTFSFTGQYSWFLNAICAFLIISFLAPSTYSQSQKNWIRWIISIGLSILFLLGVFVTGGRTAVLGTGTCIGLGFMLAGWRTPGIMVTRGLVAATILYYSFTLLAEYKPQYFAAYNARSSGTEQQSHNDEIAERVLDGYTYWLTWFWVQDTRAIWLGNGMGVMSNGVDKISTYARNIRADGTWTEGDVPTTAWEGGIYLLIVWYTFRLAVVVFCFRCWLAIKNKKYTTGAAFLLANIIVWGGMSTLAMHPPLAIWWWISIGSLLAIFQFDKAAIVRKKQVVNRNMLSQHTNCI